MVGHALHNDLKALGIAHPRELQRDTARYPPYRKGMGNGSRPQKLAALVSLPVSSISRLAFKV